MIMINEPLCFFFFQVGKYRISEYGRLESHTAPAAPTRRDVLVCGLIDVMEGWEEEMS